MKYKCFIIVVFLFSCQSVKKMNWPERNSQLNGTEFYKMSFGRNWASRDSLAVKEVLNGNIPSFLKKFVPIHVEIPGKERSVAIKATYYVSPDYLSIGNDKDWARIPLTPMAAQLIADSFNCFLPTRKMVNDIYNAAVIKPEPVPMFAFRDSTVTFWQHHLIIEGQRKERKGLIAGIKKDIVISDKVTNDPKPNRVAIYGWHKQDGRAIQPLYSGHVNWYVDYSHGVRLVARNIKVDGKWMDYTAVLKDPVLKQLLCDEEESSHYRSAY